MKHSIIATAIALSATAASAGSYAEPVGEAQPVPAAAAQTDWTGFYAGLQYNDGEAEASFGGATATGDFDGFGIHAGYNHDFGQFVVGGELAYNDIDSDGNGDGDLTQLRARAGVDLGRFMPYATLGFARVSLESGGTDVSESGVTYGVGGEYLVTDNFSIGLEYSRSDFSDVEGVNGLDLDTDMVQLRASYRF
ncbi:outer membrane protein [Leisingera caerulea]|uniref:Porin family protein n=1 Tax=Leisingera caerulea TaxID=506591 RepID=A0A9Q9HGX6_LEICA|nr:porin family protein [Leisingera caerulea]UWQ54899.1 porin family protein [Leisingera caerulea]UWQ63651.1 porin family protein [Leisingera caerulea]